MTVLASSPEGLRVRAVTAKAPRSLPQDLVDTPLYAQNLGRVQTRIREGLAFEGRYYPAVDLEVKGGEFVLHCQEVAYSRAAALGGPLSQRYATAPLPALLPATAYMGCASGVDTAVISAEGLLMLSQRSSRVGKYPNHWSAGFGEGLEASDLDRPSLGYASLRCLEEELALDLDASALERLRTVMLARENEFLTWNAYSVMDFRGLGDRFKAERLVERAAGAKDAWENAELRAMPLPAVREFLSDRPAVPATPLLLALLDQLPA